MIKEEGLDEHQKKLIAEKRAEFEAQAKQKDAVTSDYPAGATLCAKCNPAAVVMMDGCMTCLSCGDSQCGGPRDLNEARAARPALRGTGEAGERTNTVRRNKYGYTNHLHA